MLSFTVTLSASPTNEDFKKCHRLSEKYLEYCLDRLETKTDDNIMQCQNKSKNAGQRCRKNIMEQYSTKYEEVIKKRRLIEQEKIKELKK